MPSWPYGLLTADSKTPTFPLAWGVKVKIPLAFSFTDANYPGFFGYVLSWGDLDDVLGIEAWGQWFPAGADQPWFVARWTDYPPFTAILINPNIRPEGETGSLKDNVAVVVSGIKHAAYDSSGNVINPYAKGGNNPDANGIACAHQMTNAAGHYLVTNPIWVTVHVMLNLAGKPKDSIDFVTARAVADQMENPQWYNATSFSGGYDIRHYQANQISAEKYARIILPPSVEMFKSQGLWKFAQTVHSSHSSYSSKMTFTNVNCSPRVSALSRPDEKTLPVKANIKALMQKPMSDGNTDQFIYPAEIHDQVRKKQWESQQNIDIDLTALYDADGGFEKADGKSLHVLESLLALRMAMFPRTLPLESIDLNAVRLEPADDVTVNVTHNDHTFNDRALVRSRSYGESQNDRGKPMQAVDVECRFIKDEWFDPDPSANVNGSLNTTIELPTDFPHSRWRAQAAWSGTTLTLKHMDNGVDVDPRLLRKGALLWMKTSGHPSAEEHWANPRNWTFLGTVSSVSQPQGTSPNKYVTVTTTASISASYYADCRVQIVGNCISGISGKSGQSQLWYTIIQHRISAWLYEGRPVIEYVNGSVDGDYDESDPDWRDFAGDMSKITESDGSETYWQASSELPVPFLPNGYVTSPRSASSLFPLSIRLTQRNRNGVRGSISGSFSPYIYCWPLSLAIFKDYTIVNLTPKTLDQGSDLTELGWHFETDYDPAEHSNIMSFEIRYRDEGAHGAHTLGNWADGNSNLIYEGPPFRSENIADVDGLPMDDGTFAGYSVAMKTRGPGGEYTQTLGNDNLSEINLKKVHKFFDNTIGVISTTSGTPDRRGAGVVLMTPRFREYHDAFDPTDGDDYLGGFYIFGAHRPAQAANIRLWRRWGIDPISGNWELNGPTHAFEADGNAKIAFQPVVGSVAEDAWWEQAGIKLEAHPAAPWKRGIMKIGVGKNFAFHFHDYEGAGTVAGFSAGLFDGGGTAHPNLKSTNLKDFDGAAIYIEESDISPSHGSKVFINGLVAHGLVIGGIDQNNPLTIYDNTGSLYSDLNRLFLVTDGSFFGDDYIGSPPILFSVGKYGSFSDSIHTYPFVDGKSGLLYIDTNYKDLGSGTSSTGYKGIQFTGGGMPVRMRMGKQSLKNSWELDGDHAHRYLMLSTASGYAFAPTVVNAPSSTTFNAIGYTGVKTIPNGHFCFRDNLGGTRELWALLNGTWRYITFDG